MEGNLHPDGKKVW